MVAGGTDCDDNDANVNPGQTEDPNDGVDTDCDGVGDARFQTGYVDELCIDCAGPSAVAVDSAGQVHVVYEDAGDLWYRYLQAFGTWSSYENSVRMPLVEPLLLSPQNGTVSTPK